MSSIPNRHTDGDVSVGRNVTTGGSANIQGNARVGHNLRVEGWLEAPNIKGPLKGLYATAESLRGAYPEPRPGWYALVGDTLPAAVYRADRDERGKTVWAATGETGGEFVLYPDKIEREVGELRDDVRGLEGRLLTGVSFASEETYGTLSLTRSDGSVGASVGIPGMTEGKAGLMTPTRLAAIRSEITQTATDALLGVSYEAFDDHGTIWLTLPSGNRKGVGIPGMTESKAGFLTPNRLAAIRAEIQEASAESLTGIEIEQLDTFARVWSTTQGGRRSIAALLTAMDGETAGLYSPTRHRQIIGLIEQSAAAGVSRGSEALTFAASETYGTLSLTRSDGTRASAAIPGMTDGKAGGTEGRDIADDRGHDRERDIRDLRRPRDDMADAAERGEKGHRHPGDDRGEGRATDTSTAGGHQGRDTECLGTAVDTSGGSGEAGDVRQQRDDRQVQRDRDLLRGHR